MVKIGIIGSGFGMYGLLPAFGFAKNCEVTSICGEKSGRLIKYCKKFKVGKIYSDWRELLEKEDLDALAVAVAPSAQYQIAKAAIQKGLHVFLEKPVAANFKQARELYELSKKYKTVTAVDFIFPQIPEWIKAKQLLDKNFLGKLLFVRTSWDFLSYDLKHGIKGWKTDSKAGGGALRYYFSHCLYYLGYFAGEIKNIKSFLSYSDQSLNGGEVGVDMVFKTSQGITGNAHLNCAVKGAYEHKLTFMCEQGSIILKNDRNVAKHFTLEVNDGKKTYRVKAQKSFLKGFDERVPIVKKNAESFIGRCKNKKSGSPSLKDGIIVEALIDKISKSSN